MLTSSVHGGPGPRERAEALPAEGDVLLVGGQGVRLQQLSALLLPQHRVHRLQEVLLTVRRAAGERHARDDTESIKHNKPKQIEGKAWGVIGHVY